MVSATRRESSGSASRAARSRCARFKSLHRQKVRLYFRASCTLHARSPTQTMHPWPRAIRHAAFLPMKRCFIVGKGHKQHNVHLSKMFSGENSSLKPRVPHAAAGKSL